MGKKKITDTGKPEIKKPSKSKVKSGKAEEALLRQGSGGQARLADMNQKSLDDLEKVQAKEKEFEKEIIEAAGKQPKKTVSQKIRSKRYQTIKKDIQPGKKYTVTEAIESAIKNASAKFDESIEVHVITSDKLSGSVNLPHGTGKKQRIVIADDKVLAEIEKGKINFDILVATPSIMPKLGRLAKILGPKGLMPSPKMGTISDDPEKLALSLSKGQTHYKTEPKAPLMHFTIGKASFGPKKLIENLDAFIKAVKLKNITGASLSSSMGPGIKLDLSGYK